LEVVELRVEDADVNRAAIESALHAHFRRHDDFIGELASCRGQRSGWIPVAVVTASLEATTGRYIEISIVARIETQARVPRHTIGAALRDDRYRHRQCRSQAR
jgi:hypothetical protein